MHLTQRALFLLYLTAPLLLLATWSPNLAIIALLYLLALIALFIFDWWQADSIDRFEIKRTHDLKLSLGAENLIELTVRNRRGHETVIWLRDEPPDQFQISERFFTGALPAKSSWQESYHLRPLRRGHYQFGNLNLRWLAPLKLVVRAATFPAETDIKVYPNLLNVRQYDLMMQRNRLQLLGLRNSRQFGEGTEFERLREYLPDDDFRRINWKATARRNHPITMEYQTERSQTIVALIDIGRMMQSPVADMAKLDYVINAALLLGYVATGMGDKVGLLTFADKVEQYLTPKTGRAQFYQMLEKLYHINPIGVEPDYGAAFTYLAYKQRKRALIVIFTDLSSGLSMKQLVEHLARLAKRSLPLVVAISDPDLLAMAQKRPTNSDDLYQRAAAQQLLDERQLIVDSLRQQGVHTIDVPADQLSLSVINRYLTLKGKGLL